MRHQAAATNSTTPASCTSNRAHHATHTTHTTFPAKVHSFFLTMLAGWGAYANFLMALFMREQLQKSQEGPLRRSRKNVAFFCRRNRWKLRGLLIFPIADTFVSLYRSWGGSNLILGSVAGIFIVMWIIGSFFIALFFLYWSYSYSKQVQNQVRGATQRMRRADVALRVQVDRLVFYNGLGGLAIIGYTLSLIPFFQILITPAICNPSRWYLTTLMICYSRFLTSYAQVPAWF